MRVRHVGNNWVPYLCLAALFLFTGAVSMVAERGNGTSPGVFVGGIVVVSAASILWLRRNPSWQVVPRKSGLYMAGGTLAGAVVSAFIPALNGCGPWLVLGAALAVYGYFERLNLLVSAAVAVFITGFLAMVVQRDVWGGGMELLAAAVMAVAANRLYVLRHGRRRETVESDPDFVGQFMEFEPDEPPNFWQSVR